MLIKHGEFKYKSAIVLTPKIMKELDSILSDYAGDLRYYANSTEKSEMEFSSLDELLESENGFQQKINSISIYALNSSFHANIMPDKDPTFNFSITATVDYTYSKSNEELLFNSELKTVFSKARAPYSWLYKFNLIQPILALAVLCILSIIIFAYLEYDFTRLGMSPAKTISSLTNGIIITVFIYVFQRMLKKILPPIVFLWGEGIKEEQTRNGWRTGIFWTVIIGTALAIILKLVLG